MVCHIVSSCTIITEKVLTYCLNTTHRRLLLNPCILNVCNMYIFYGPILLHKHISNLSDS
jgi:hypothetical protein